MTTDYTDYFVNRAADGSTGGNQTTPPQDPKFVELQKASEAKIAELDLLQKSQVKQEALAKLSWAGRMGAAPDGVVGTVVNAGASLVQGAALVESQIGTTLHTAYAKAIDAKIPDAAKAAYANFKAGKATPQELTLLNGRLAGDTFDPQYPEAYAKQITDGGETNMKRIERFNDAMGKADQVRAGWDLSSITDNTAQDVQTDQLKAGFKENAPQVEAGVAKIKDGKVLEGAGDALSGLAGLFKTIGAGAVNNPKASTELIIKNAPQLLLAAGGGAGMALTNIPYAVDAFGQGISEYQKANNGAVPPDAQMREMAAWAASLAVAETVGDKIVLGPALAKKGLGAVAAAVTEKAAAKGAAGAAKDEITQGFKQTLAAANKAVSESLPGRALIAVGEGGVGEFATEAYQTAVEEKIKGNLASAEDVFVGGALGAISGAGLSGGAHVVKEVLGREPSEAKTSAPAASRGEAVAAAIVSGDVSTLTDPKKADTYAPEKAVAALQAHAAQPDATPEVKAANLEKANEIVATLEKEQAKAQGAYDQASGAANADSEFALKHYSELLAKTDPADTAKVAEYQAEIAAVEKDIADAPKVDTKVAEQFKLELSKVDTRLDKARQAMAQFHQSTQSTEVDTVAQAEVVNAPVDATDTAAVASRAQAADTIINLSMAIPERLDATVATQLAANPNNGLTAAQRTYFREFSAARLADNKVKDVEGVSSDVLYGSKKGTTGTKYVGLSQYRARVSQSLTTGNKALAEQHLAELNKFSVDHQAKAAVAAEALAAGPGSQIMRVKNGPWKLLDQRMPFATVSANGGLTLHDNPKSAQLFAAVAAEADAVTSTAKELNAAFALKFSTPATTTPGVSNVANVSKPSSVPQAVSTQQQAPAVASGPVKTATVVAGTAPAGTGSTEVAATGVTQSTSAKPAVDSKAAPLAPTTSSRTEGEQQSTKENVADTQVAESSQSAEQTTEKAASTLTVLDKKSAEGTPYTLQHLLADHFTQSAAKESDVTQRPLAKVQDFFSSLVAKSTTAAEFLADKALSEEQKGSIQSFLKHFRVWESKITENLPKVKQDRFKHEDMMQFFMSERADGTVDVDQNVKMAIAHAVYSWVADAATAPARLKAKEINSILGRSKDARVSPEANKLLGLAGTYQHNLVDSLGGQIMEVLGLKANADAPQNLEAKVRVALGAHALKLLEDQGLAKRTTLTGTQIKTLRQEGMTEKEIAKQAPTNVDIPHYFFSVARNKDLSVIPAVSAISEASKGTKDVLGKLFGATPSVKIPSLTPIVETQATTSGTKQALPAVLKSIVEANQAHERRVRKDTMELFAGFSEDELHAMMGVVPEENKLTHLVNRSSVEAKNAGLKREWALFQQYVGEYLATAEKGLDTPLFLEFSVWKQQRVGVATTAVNPQSSKIHRFLIASKEWTTEIDPADEKLMASFYLRVAEGLGVKTERADNDVSIATVQKMLLDPLYADAIAALRKSLSKAGELTTEEKASIVKATAAGGANLHTLDALIGVAYQLEADGKPFTVQMMGEVDGVANGTMLNHVLMGAGFSADSLQAFLNQGGFYEEGSEYTQYNQYRGTLGNLDVYETTAKRVYESVAAMFTKGDPQIASIWSIAGDIFNDKTRTVTKDGRNLVKEALNPLAFGSSLEAVVRGMSDTFVDAVYKGFEKLSNNGADQDVVSAYVKNINNLIRNPDFHLPESQTLEWHMEHAMSSGAEAQIKKTFADTVGQATSDVVEQDFAPFLAARNALNKSAQATYGLYEAVYRGEREAYIEELLAAGSIPLDDKGNRIGDLSKTQEAVLEKRVRAIAPVIGTAMSENDKGNRTGLLMAKTKRKQNQDPTYSNITQFGTEMATGQKQLTLRGQSSQIESPGVAMGSATTHSLDSYISHLTQKERDVLNVHDAVGDGVGGLEESARLMNQNTWKALLNYSPLNAVYESMTAVLGGIAAMQTKGELSPQATKYLQEFLFAEAKKNRVNSSEVLSTLLGNAKQSAFMADDNKLTVMKTWASVDQYAYQGGNYEVKAEDRAAAATKQEALSPELTQEAKDALKVLADVLKAKPVIKATPVAKVAEDLDVADDLGDDTPEPGDLEQIDPVAEVLPQLSPLQELLSKNPTTTAGELMKQLRRQITGTDRMSQFHLQLLRLLNKTVSDDLLVEVKALTGRYGAYRFDSTTGTEKIQLTGDNALEASLHELTHAALARTVASEPKNPLVVELDQLRALAATYAKDQNITGFDAALVDVQEFITWGMTNQEFQRTVLSKLSMESKNKGNSLVNGMKAFIDKIVGLLFAGSTKSELEQANNGMSVLISNVSGLFNQVGTKGQPGAANINLSMASDPIGTLDTFGTIDIHNALNSGAVSASFELHLRDVLGSIVEKLQGPFGAFRELAKKNRALTPLDVWTKAQATGLAPFASSVQGAPLKASQQEEFAMEMVEATVRAALERNEVSTKVAYRQLNRLYTEMKETLKATMPAAEHDFIFKLEQGADGRSNHLARFAAYGLAHEGFNKTLQVATKTTDLFPKQKTVSQKLQSWFESLVEFLHDKVTQVYAGQQADEKLQTLIGTLVDIEAKKLVSLARPDPGLSKYNVFEKVTTRTLTARMKATREIARSDIIKNSRFTGVRMLGQFLLLTDPQKVEQIVTGMSAVREKHWEGRLGIVAGSLNYAISSSKKFEGLLRERKRLEGERKDIITNRAAMVLAAFDNQGKDLAKEGDKLNSSSASITSVFLRTGLHVLTGQFSLGELENMLGDKAARDAAINTLENKLNVFGRFKDEFVDKANALAYYKATGEVRIETMLMNAYSISQLHGSTYRGRLTEAQSNQAEAVIEQLVALYALNYTDKTTLGKAQQVMRTEAARTDGGNGVSFVMALQKRLEQESLARNFHGNKALMVHGFTPEIYSPYVDVKTVNEAEGKALEKLGYTRVGAAVTDPADPTNGNGTMSMYVLNDGGLMPHLTGIVAYNGLTAKGGQSKAHSGYMNTFTTDGKANAAKQAAITNAKQQGLYVGARRDLSKESKSYMAPVINEQGNIVNWRYLMQDSTKDSVLKRDNRANMILGVLAGSIFDKETVAETNNKAMKALKEQFNADEKTANLEGYAFIGPKSTNKQDRETWMMLPDSTKAEVRKIWGTDGLYVHNNMRDIVFGYRKLSLADAITSTEERREWAKLGVVMPKGSWDDQLEVVLSRMFTEVMEHFYGKEAATKVRKGERIWMEIVGETKDLVVIKSVSTMMGNIKSNTSLLFLSGVPPWAILKHHITAWRGATTYEKDSKELDRLTTLIDTNQVNGSGMTLAQMNQQVLRLKDSIARNPVKLLIDNGLMPSIVEDTSADEDIYSYKSLLTRKVAGVTNGVPELLKSTAKQLYMGKDTVGYQTLRHITQLSDFMARYTQYQHLTTRKVNPLSSADAIQQASDDFVNYDIPMHRGMQYLDDTGIFMFSKYYLRIQKVISRMFKENTARMLGALALGGYMDLGPIVLDSSWVHKLGNNPLNWGALQYPGSLDELGTVKAVMSLIK